MQVNCTQCASGTVDEIYETGSVLRECDVISGFDMTVEAALTKLSYVLGKDEWPLETKKQVKCYSKFSSIQENVLRYNMEFIYCRR